MKCGRRASRASISLPHAAAALTSISVSAGPAPVALGAAGAAPPSGPPLLPLLLPPAPAAEGLEGALSGGGGGGGSAVDDMFRLRHPPRPRAGAAPREAAWACAALASGPPEERDPPGSSHAQGLRHRPEPAQPRRSPSPPLPVSMVPKARWVSTNEHCRFKSCTDDYPRRQAPGSSLMHSPITSCLQKVCCSPATQPWAFFLHS